MLAAFDRLKEALQGKRLKAARKFVNTCNGGPKLCSAEKRTHFDRKTPANFRKSPANSRKSEKVVVLMIKASHAVHWHVGKCCEVNLLCMANARLETTQFVCVFAQIVAKPLEFGKS